jgi:hypothetical protein
MNRARSLNHANIENEFLHNRYSDFIENLAKTQTIAQNKSLPVDDVTKAKELIKTAIKNARSCSAHFKCIR